MKKNTNERVHSVRINCLTDESKIRLGTTSVRVEGAVNDTEAANR